MNQKTVKKIKAVHFGAGKIGRGLIAQIYNQNNLDIVFVDSNPENLANFEKFKKYNINFFDTNKSVTIENFNLLSSENQNEIIKQLREASIVSTSIGSKNLKFLVDLFVKAYKDIELKQCVQIICFENGYRITSEFKKQVDQFMKNQKVNFLDVVVDRIVPEQKNEDWSINTESEYEIVADSEQHNSASCLTLSGVKYTKKLNAYIDRKLVLVNAIHTLIGLLGWNSKYKYIEESLKDDKILNIIKNYQQEAINALLAENPKEFIKKDLEDYAKKILNRVKNPFLKDTNLRVIRNPITKMKSNERYMTILNISLKHGLKYDYLLIPFFLLVNLDTPDDQESKELKSSIQKIGVEKTLLQFTKLPEELVQKISSLKELK